MNAIRLLVICLGFTTTSALFAAEVPDPTLLLGLKAFETNGLDAATAAWYPDQPAVAAEMRNKLLEVTKNLGEAIDSEVVSIQPVSKRVTRYYVAVYFNRTPVWIRLERYSGRDRTFFFPLKFSTNPDQILPAYLTEFQQ